MYNYFVFILLGTIVVLSINNYTDKGIERNDVEGGESLSQIEQEIDSTDWKEVKTVEEVWHSYPDRIRFLIEQLALDKTGLEEVKIAIQNGDTVKAAKALIAYYKGSNSGFWLRNKSFKTLESSVLIKANQLLDDIVNFSGTQLVIPSSNKGGWQWNFKGPKKDKEVAYKLNAHEYLISLYRAGINKKNDQFIKKIDLIIRDWIIHNPLPSRRDSMFMVLNTSTETLDWRDISEVNWRDLEAGVRMGTTWPQIFYGFQQSEDLLPATRILMLSSIAEHAEYLREYHKEGSNWTILEMHGLSLIGLAFPEFRQTEDWAQYALEVMEKEINDQVYPDGTQTELSTKIQWTALKRFESLADNFTQAGRTVPERYVKRLEDMYQYLAYSMRPDGHQPLNNDSDREDLRPRLLKAAEKYDRPDWQWIATNGKAGRKPEGLPSKVFPWAGIHIMRSGWDQDDQWAFFDTGPFGTGHQHSDKLHLSVSAYGQDLLVDGGRYTHENYFSFDPTTWRGYFRSSFSHNVILIDGHGQTRESNRIAIPLQEGVDYISKPTFDYARGTYAGGYAKVEGKAEHSRAVLYVRGKYWVVVDHIITDRPRNIQVLWHYAPDLQIQKDSKQVFSTNSSRSNLRIVPISTLPWSVELIEGQKKPVIQGWYSAEYGKKESNPTAVYNTKIEEGNATFAWLLMPAKEKTPIIKTDIVDVDSNNMKIFINEIGLSPAIVTVPLNESISPKLEKHKSVNE